MRTIKEIYNEIISEKNKRLELSEINSSSKVSVMNGIAWVCATAIHAVEIIMDTFVADVSDFVNSKIHGTADFYAMALLKYQHGDELEFNEDLTGVGYRNIDESKRIVTKVAYSEYETDLEKDNRVLYKIAKGQSGSLQPVTEEELVAVKSYIDKIKYVGTNIDVVSKKGDILVPRVTVYHNGQIPESEMMSNIIDALNSYMTRLTFDASVKKTDILDVIKHIDNVTDVYIDKSTEPKGGLYVAQYVTNDEISQLVEIDRVIDLASGYLNESTRIGIEKDIPKFSEVITLKISQ